MPTTHKKTNANKMRPRSSHAMQRFTRVCLHAQTAVQCTYTPGEPWLFWSREKPEYLQFEPHAGINMAQVLGSPLYICGILTECGPKTVSDHDGEDLVHLRGSSYIHVYINYVCFLCHLPRIKSDHRWHHTKLHSRKFTGGGGGICCGDHLSITYGGDLLYLWIFS